MKDDQLEPIAECAWKIGGDRGQWYLHGAAVAIIHEDWDAYETLALLANIYREVFSE